MARSKLINQKRLEANGGTGAATVTKNALQAFIAAPPATDTSVIRAELDRRGIHAYELDEVSSAGMSPTELLEESIRRAQLVVVVLGGDKSENVLVELGFALALRKRVLAIVPPGKDLPIEPVPCLRTNPANQEAIDFGLTQVLAAPGPLRPAKDVAPPKTKPLGPIADDLLQRLQAAVVHPDDQKMGEIVCAALTASGISVMARAVTETAALGSRTDFAIWSEDFEPWLGNPLLIGVRSLVADVGELKRTLEQMTRKIERTRSPGGVATAWWRGGDTENGGILACERVHPACSAVPGTAPGDESGGFAS